jgi:phage gp16-like protein
MTSSIAAIHVAKRDLGLDDDTYRAKLAIITGKSSVKDMTEGERQRVLEVFRSEGFKPAAARRPDGRRKLSGRFAAKLQALWIAGWNLGIFDNRDDAALEKFVKRQTGLDAVRFCHDAADAKKAIEALKSILAREGGVDWIQVPGTAPPSPAFKPTGLRVAQAQWLKLYGNGQGFIPAILDMTGHDHRCKISNGEWITVMNELGKQIRAAKKAGA